MDFLKVSDEVAKQVAPIFKANKWSYTAPWFEGKEYATEKDISAMIFGLLCELTYNRHTISSGRFTVRRIEASYGAPKYQVSLDFDKC